MVVGVYLDKERVSDTQESEETVISETPRRNFKNINKLINNIKFSIQLHFQDNLSYFSQLTGGVPVA